jgi:hypothetical protein
MGLTYLVIVTSQFSYGSDLFGYCKPASLAVGLTYLVTVTS